MPSRNLRCPNPGCQQKDVAIHSSRFVCSVCGTQIDAQHALEAELRRTRRKARLASLYPHLWALGLVSVMGLMFHEIGRLALIAFPVFVALAIFSLVTKNGKARDFGALSLASFLFFVFSIVGDVLNPPAAICADGSLSHSAHRSGTCSWHGGVMQWNPPQWWER